MTETLTPGRWRGLQLTGNSERIFTILAFDQRESYEKMLPKDTSYEDAVHIKTEIVGALSPHVSGVLLDHKYGLEAAQHLTAHVGLLMALEKSGYSGDSTYRRIEFIDEWTVGKIKRTGASAVKLLAYYHPGSGALAEEIEGVISHVRDECHRYDLPLFVEPMCYSLDTNVAKDSPTFAKTLPDVVRETAQRLGALKPDILKLEFPVNTTFEHDQNVWRAACEALTKASPVPWVLLSAGVDFDKYAPQVEVACRAGASGFLAGRAIWKESVGMPADKRQQFINDTAISRVKRLTETALKYAHPWTNYYAPLAASEDWFASYPEM
ncbi:MAG: tagatose 1,6-diphosphate aldolase [Aggregatilineales bacterium]